MLYIYHHLKRVYIYRVCLFGMLICFWKSSLSRALRILRHSFHLIFLSALHPSIFYLCIFFSLVASRGCKIIRHWDMYDVRNINIFWCVMSSHCIEHKSVEISLLNIIAKFFVIIISFRLFFVFIYLLFILLLIVVNYLKNATSALFSPHSNGEVSWVNSSCSSKSQLCWFDAMFNVCSEAL